MITRKLKIVFVALISLLCLFYAGQNIANLDACYQAFAYVMSMADHQVYQNSFLPPITASALVWIALLLVVGLEFAAGLIAAKGAHDLWAARNGSATEFNAAKSNALLGTGLGIIVWLGFFGVFGNGLFQMWQTVPGGQSAAGAFQYFASCALVFLIVNSPDE